MRNFISLADHSPEQVSEILQLAVRLKDEWSGGGNRPLLEGKILAMVFQKPSLRTRVSFDVAMRQLAGDALYLSPDEIGLGKREAVRDVGRVLGGYVDCVMARVFDHAHVVGLAASAGVPVINGLSDFNHPCQAMADALTILERFDSLEGIKLSYIGDGNNVATSLLFASAQLGMDFSIASPAGYELDPETVAAARTLAEHSGAQIDLLEDPTKAVSGAQVVYTDTWVSMGQEADTAERQEALRAYQVNAALMASADPQAIAMHCLPAHRGQEITDEVMDGAQSAVFQQAENRLHAQKAILVKLLT